jgi:hypothetical protein
VPFRDKACPADTCIASAVPALSTTTNGCNGGEVLAQGYRFLII